MFGALADITACAVAVIVGTTASTVPEARTAILRGACMSELPSGADGGSAVPLPWSSWPRQATTAGPAPPGVWTNQNEGCHRGATARPATITTRRRKRDPLSEIVEVR